MPVFRASPRHSGHAISPVAAAARWAQCCTQEPQKECPQTRLITLLALPRGSKPARVSRGRSYPRTDRTGERGDEVVEHFTLALIAEQQDRVGHGVMHALRLEPLDFGLSARPGWSAEPARWFDVQRRPQLGDRELLLDDGRIARRQQRFRPPEIGAREVEPILELLARLSQDIDRVLQRRLGALRRELSLARDGGLLAEVVEVGAEAGCELNSVSSDAITSQRRLREQLAQRVGRNPRSNAPSSPRPARESGASEPRPESTRC